MVRLERDLANNHAKSREVSPVSVDGIDLPCFYIEQERTHAPSCPDLLPVDPPR